MIKNVYISQQKYEPFNGHWKPLFCCWKCLAERGLAQRGRTLRFRCGRKALVWRARVLAQLSGGLKLSWSWTIVNKAAKSNFLFLLQIQNQEREKLSDKHRFPVQIVRVSSFSAPFNTRTTNNWKILGKKQFFHKVEEDSCFKSF